MAQGTAMIIGADSGMFSTWRCLVRGQSHACAHVTSENSCGGTSGFMMRVHFRMLQCGMIANNIKSQDIVSFSTFAEFRWHLLSFQFSYSFKDFVLVQF